MPTEKVYRVCATFHEREDALALMDLINDMGLGITLTLEQKEAVPGPRTWNTRLSRYLMASMTVPGKTYDFEHFRMVCEEHGYSPDSGSPMLSRLVEADKIRRIAPGLFRLVL